MESTVIKVEPKMLDKVLKQKTNEIRYFTKWLVEYYYQFSIDVPKKPVWNETAQPAITRCEKWIKCEICSKLTIKTLERRQSSHIETSLLICRANQLTGF